nr:M23 family metallopeptidase [Bacillus sp. 03113]
MTDFVIRLFITGIMALCFSFLFIEEKHPQAEIDGTNNWIWPAEGIITDTYGTRHGQHKGIDIAAAYGSPVYAVDNGVISKSYYSNSYGHVVFIKHPNHTETVYAHLKKREVMEGQFVNQGEIIGEMGNTGDSSGVHLHFEMHLVKWTYRKDNAVDPVLAFGDVSKGSTVYALNKEENAVVAASKINQQKNEQDNHDITIKSHQVMDGETLWSIAEAYHSSVESIRQKNALENEQIFVGQTLLISIGENKQGYSLNNRSLKSSQSSKESHHEKGSQIKPYEVYLLQK